MAEAAEDVAAPPVDAPPADAPTAEDAPPADAPPAEASGDAPKTLTEQLNERNAEKRRAAAADARPSAAEAAPGGDSNANDMPAALSGDGVSKRKPGDVAAANQAHAEAAAAKDGGDGTGAHKEPLPDAQRVNIEPDEEHHDEAEEM